MSQPIQQDPQSVATTLNTPIHTQPPLSVAHPILNDTIVPNQSTMSDEALASNQSMIANQFVSNTHLIPHHQLANQQPIQHNHLVSTQHVINNQPIIPNPEMMQTQPVTTEQQSIVKKEPTTKQTPISKQIKKNSKSQTKPRTNRVQRQRNILHQHQQQASRNENDNIHTRKMWSMRPFGCGINPYILYHKMFSDEFPTALAVTEVIANHLNLDPKEVGDALRTISPASDVVDANCFASCISYFSVANREASLFTLRLTANAKCSGCKIIRPMLHFLDASSDLSPRCNKCRRTTVITKIPDKIYIYCVDEGPNINLDWILQCYSHLLQAAMVLKLPIQTVFCCNKFLDYGHQTFAMPITKESQKQFHHYFLQQLHLVEGYRYITKSFNKGSARYVCNQRSDQHKEIPPSERIRNRKTVRVYDCSGAVNFSSSESHVMRIRISHNFLHDRLPVQDKPSLKQNALKQDARKAANELQEEITQDTVKHEHVQEIQPIQPSESDMPPEQTISAQTHVPTQSPT